MADLNEILEERGKRYGDFMDHATITQAFKSLADSYAPGTLVRNGVPTPFFAPDQAEALDMLFHKLGRILAGDPDYADSWVDIAGYSKLVADRLECE
jgi:hypothetical protein